ncbi:carbohydrate ABC transporter permease [Streptomyces sp. NPDC049954]|uniref:carbohydrate ABC transporter permease n=1 Tax=Streptomyces sp. NPDC049954 TaxID=3155779 RepID=UPI0034187173
MTTTVRTQQTRQAEGLTLPPVDRTPLRRRRRTRALQQCAAVAISLFMGIPLYLIAVAALSSREGLSQFPLSFLPNHFSFSTVTDLFTGTAVGPSMVNSLLAGLWTVGLSLVVGAPAGYAMARFVFRGQDAYQLVLLLVRALPVVVLSVPLAELFLNAGMFDSVVAVALVHTGLALPTTILITASIFVSVPRDLEEAALLFGCGRFGAFRRVVVPMAAPGIAASSVFTFVLSWNEVLASAVLTLNHRTLPAQILTSLRQSSLPYQFAGGLVLVVPGVLFILFMRRYLLNMWGSSAR